MSEKFISIEGIAKRYPAPAAAARRYSGTSGLACGRANSSA
jgi:hypothetical protein